MNNSIASDNVCSRALKSVFYYLKNDRSKPLVYKFVNSQKVYSSSVHNYLYGDPKLAPFFKKLEKSIKKLIYFPCWILLLILSLKTLLSSLIAPKRTMHYLIDVKKTGVYGVDSRSSYVLDDYPLSTSINLFHVSNPWHCLRRHWQKTNAFITNRF